MVDVEKIREEFPILHREVYGKPLVYLDSGATAQKPRTVIETVDRLHRELNANIHRGVHFLSEEATVLYEAARERIASFVGAAEKEEIVFTAGATASLNTVAYAWGDAFVGAGDNILVSEMEHHSNIVPWQLLQERKGIRLRVIPINDRGELLLDEYEKLFNKRTRIVAVTHVSNVLGTVNPVKQIAAVAHAHGVPVLVDGAQSVPHIAVDVQDMDCDFFVFSGHKVYGPTGIGVLYGKESLLNELPPYQGGGEMIKNVHFEHTEYEDAPLRFEAGTPDYVGAHALAAAIDYVSALGMENIAAHEHSLLAYATERMNCIPGMRIFGQAENKSAVLSFVVGNIHPLDLGTLLDRFGVAVRTGHHCAQPLMERMGVQSMARASFALYNTREEVDTLCESIERITKMF